MKDMKFLTKLMIGFVVLDILVLAILYCGYSTASKILTVDNPKQYLHNYSIFTVILFLVVLVVMGFISIGVSHTLRKSLEQLSEASKQLAAGKVHVEFQKVRNDEFGQLIDEYQTAIHHLRYQAEVASEIADGNLMVEVKTRSDKDAMGVALRKLVERNYNALSNISDAAAQVMTSSSEVASASEALAQGSTEQASAVEEITASIGDIADKTKQNATEADSAAKLMADAIEAVKKGNEQMQHLTKAMEDINASSESISKIIKVIDDIAFQTNILALNAAVEAARAGEAGKGFAVVAEEVRSLAAKSAAAAAETSELIEDSIHKVSVGSGIVDESARALGAITETVRQSEGIVRDIAEASNYQATAIVQIDQAVGQVSQVVQNNSATSQECAAASVELSNQANRMSDLLSVFNLGAHRAGVGYSTPRRYQGGSDHNEQIISLGDGFGKY